MSDRSEKLKPEEKSLYRRVCLARVHEGASVEAADRQAMQMVKIWHDRGAFDEPSDRVPGTLEMFEMYERLLDQTEFCGPVPENIDLQPRAESIATLLEERANAFRCQFKPKA